MKIYIKKKTNGKWRIILKEREGEVIFCLFLRKIKKSQKRLLNEL